MDKKFIRFKLDNVWSAKDPVNKNFNAFIVHDGVLEFFNTPGFSNEIVFPKLGDHSVFLGVEHEGLELEYQLLVKEVTMDGYREFLDWLNFDSERKIYFDYQEDLDDNPGYRTVRVSHISRGEIWFIGNCEDGESLYNVSLEVGFITVGDWAVNYETGEEINYADPNDGELYEFYEVTSTDYNQADVKLDVTIQETGGAGGVMYAFKIQHSQYYDDIDWAYYSGLVIRAHDGASYSYWALVILYEKFTNEGSLPMFFDIQSSGIVHIKADDQTIIEIDENQGDFLLDTRTGILHENAKKDSFFKGKVDKQAVRYMLKPGKSVTFKKTGNSSVTITGHRRDYI